MHRLDLTLPDLAANLALDEALLLAAEAGQFGEVLRFWEWPSPAVVLGAGGRIADDAKDDRAGHVHLLVSSDTDGSTSSA